MEMKVNPCPFCGGEAKLMGGKVYTIPEIDRNGAYVGADIEVEPSWVECQSCHAIGQVFDESDEDPENAVAAWNAAGGKAHPVRHGRWLDGCCTVCGWEFPDCCSYDGYAEEPWTPTPFCPMCGSEMQEVQP